MWLAKLQIFHELSVSEAKIVAYFTSEMNGIFIYLFSHNYFDVTMDICVNCQPLGKRSTLQHMSYRNKCRPIMEIINNIATIK